MDEDDMLSLQELSSVFCNLRLLLGNRPVKTCRAFERDRLGAFDESIFLYKSSVT